MKKKGFRVFTFLFLCVILLGALYYIPTTYAKYRKKVNGSVNFDMASWHILVNDEDIVGKTQLTNKIIPAFPGDEYTKENVIAPGVVGYYDIIIDPSVTDVSFDYTILSESPSDSSVLDLVTLGYVLNPVTGNEAITPVDVGGITGTLEHNSSALTVRVFVEWDDSDTNIMDNVQDTQVAADSTSKAYLNVTLTFTQKQ